MIHLGMVYVGLPYVDNPELFATEAKGVSLYGVSTIAGADDNIFVFFLLICFCTFCL